MRKALISVLLAANLLWAAPKKPKLVLAIIIDQFRFDYTTRFRGEYSAGFNRLLTKGAVFTHANYVHFPTVTAVGHATFLSGATPSVSGIVGNDWFDPEDNKHVTSVSDSNTQLLGGNGEGASPHRLMVSTIPDEIKLANGNKSRVIGISLKDRAAILPVGHMADGAYWFDLKTGNFVTSTYYQKALPGWVADFNNSKPTDKYKGITWLNHKLPVDLKEMYGTSDKSPLEASPFGNELLEIFTERALAGEQLGKHEGIDVLAVSFSSNDKVGHDYGPFSPEQHEVTVRTDKILEKLFLALDRQVGMDNVLVVLTGDHGVAPSAEESIANRIPGGRIGDTAVKTAVLAALVKKFGPGDWVAGSWDLSIYLNRELIAKKGLDAAIVRRAAADAAQSVSHVARVYTRDQLSIGSVPGDEMSRRVMNGFNPKRGYDIAFIPDPYWIVTKNATTHGTPYSYDAHVPVIFMGVGIRPGKYDAAATVNDIAPTLASILEVETPAGAYGRVLAEMFLP